MSDYKGKVLIDGVPATVAEYKQWEAKLRATEIKHERKRGRYTIAYKRWRMAVLERDLFTCTLCGCVGGHLEVHHKQSYAKHPDLREEIDNGVTMCYECHSELHGGHWGWFYDK